jgi:hypothetical protein
MKVKKTKVYQLFACLNMQERKDFSRFLAGHSKPRRITLQKSLSFLCTLGKEADLGMPDVDVDVQVWWAEVFPKEKFSEREMGRHQNVLIADLEAFLVDRKQRKEADNQVARLRKCEQMLLLLSGLRERGQDRLFWQYARKMDKLLASLTQDGECFRLGYQFGLLEIAQKHKEGTRATLEDFVACKRDLDRSYSLDSLLLLLGMGAKMPASSPHASLFDLDCIQRLLAQHPLPIPLAELMLEFLTLPADYGIAHWNALHDLLKADLQQKEIPQQLWIELANSLFGLTKKHIVAGKEEFKEAALRFYELIDAREVLPQVFRESPAHYYNVLAVSLACGELALYIRCQDLEKEDQKKEVSGARSELIAGIRAYYIHKDFKSAHSHFLKAYHTARQDEKPVQYAAGIYIIRCLYELREFDAMKEFKARFQHSVMGDKQLKPESKDAYRGFFKVVAELARIHFNGVNDKERKRLLELRERVTATPAIVSRKWLLEKIDELL